MEAELRRAARGLGLDISSPAPRLFGRGLIHTTWRFDTSQGPHLLQCINSNVFVDPIAVVENAAAAATRVDDALHRVGDHDPRHRLVFVNGPEGRPWTLDDAGRVWRASVMIPGARPADPTRPAEVREAARALGRFPGLVATGAGRAPQEVIPGFHDTAARLEALGEAVETDRRGRLSGCRDEVDHLLSRTDLACRLPVESQPARLVHNDAKLDNVLVDEQTGEALCVIDLDTVMPGMAVHDFGDLVRSAVTGRPEDEPDLSRIEVRRLVFRDLASAYLQGAVGWIGEAERARLVDGALAITYEGAARFLTDYLEGDLYFPVDDAEHNLRRARAQVRLLGRLLALEDDLGLIVAEI